VPDPYFRFIVCNHSHEFATIAVMAREKPGSSRFIVQGWAQAASGQCGVAGRYPKGEFYALATNAHATWQGTDIRLCVTRQQFERLNTPGYSCQPGETLFGFRRFVVTDNEITWNLSQ
jgi:uncharacterized membrane protein